NSLKSMNTGDASTSSATTATQEMYLSDSQISETLKLYQNAPNPFNERTTIKCFVPQNIQKAQLCVYNMKGIQVQCLSITERGDVEIHIEAGALSSGVYSYVLIGDGAASDTKQMILTK
ncbi:MAG: T9SS type A sorting domain-containing protein, partial [Bacteroidetes bacterium]|nr:T9SS type A sorting domain-containing protein [Bacteroidota bacterium]